MDTDSPWQPMDSAPKDHPIIAQEADGTTYVVEWMDNAGYTSKRHKPLMQWCVPCSWQDEQGGFHDVVAVRWMEIPK